MSCPHNHVVFERNYEGVETFEIEDIREPASDMEGEPREVKLGWLRSDSYIETTYACLKCWDCGQVLDDQNLVEV